MLTEDDVFSNKGPIIVDCDVLEAAKENVQPLASGRRVTALSTILSTPHVHREAKLSATRGRLRVNVALALDDEDGDPLEAYCRLVYWTVENYPQGPSVESGLIELLEEATRVLKDDRDGQWREDLRYLKLWLLYASFVEKPTIIYKFLLANEIGTDFALLYEEYGAVLERDGRRKEADDAYKLGIARRATPVEHLRSRYSEFQKRMMSNVAPAVAPAAPSPIARPVLAMSSKTPSQAAPHCTLAHSSTTRSNNARMPIFVDPTGSEARAAEASENAWTELNSRKVRVKENIPEVKKLAGATLKQAGRSKRMVSSSSTSAATSSTRIVPYRDPESAEMTPLPVQRGQEAKPGAGVTTPFVDRTKGSTSGDEPSTPMFTPFRDETTLTPVTAAASVPESVMKVKKGGMKAPMLASEAEALRKDPLKNYGDANIEDG